MRLKAVSTMGVIVLVLCLAAFPVIKYAGGRACMPLHIALIPAEIVPLGIGLLGAVRLVVAFIASLIARRDQAWTLGALAVAITATAIYLSCAGWLPGFLHGLRDRFAGQVGYPKMREFATEVLTGTPLTSAEGVIKGPGRSPLTSDEQIRAWNDLVSRYPFLTWVRSSALIVARDGLVGLTWGSPLVGHWGFEVTPDGAVREMTEEDRGRSLRVAEDIQFVYYED